MSVDASELGRRDLLKLLTRAFGWGVLAHFVVWMISNILTHTFDWPGAAAIYSGEGGLLAFIQWVAYPLVIGATLYWVWRSEQNGLRQDSEAIAKFNIMLVRWAFFAVFFVGLADMAISFLRV